MVPKLLLAALVVGGATVAQGRVVGAAVIPHGDFCYDPSLVNRQNGSQQLHDAAVRVGASIDALRPELVLLTTPHGMALERDFAVYENSNASGFASIGQDLHNASFPQYKVELSRRGAPEHAGPLARALQAGGANVSGLLTFADSEPAALRWGEVVPLSFLARDGAPTLVWSMPQRRYLEDVSMVPELIGLGAQLYDYLEALTERVVVVVSSDLAHTHLASGPYGYSATAEPFDEAAGAWAATLDAAPLLENATAIVDQALSCGFTGLVMLHGLVRAILPLPACPPAPACAAAPPSLATRRLTAPVCMPCRLPRCCPQLERGGGAKAFTPKLWANAHPTYYGMLVASFMRQGAAEAVAAPRLRGGVSAQQLQAAARRRWADREI